MLPVVIERFHPALRRLRRALLLAAGVGGLLLPGRAVDAQFTVIRLEEHLVLGRDSLTQVISVKSESDTLQQLRIDLKDWMRDSLGNNVYDTLGSVASSCRDRLDVFPRAFQLPPRATEYFRVTYRPTGADDRGCWSILLLEAVKPPSVQQTQGGAVTVTVLTGIKYYVHPADEVADGDVEYADVEERWERPVDGDSVRVRELVVRFANTGTAHLRLRSGVEIRNEDARLVRELKAPDAYITPGAFRDVIVRLPTLAPGRYAAIALLDYGAAEIKAAQVEFEVP